MRTRDLRGLGGALLAAVLLLSAASEVRGVGPPARGSERAPSKYLGTWTGETVQGHDVFFRVNKMGQIRALEFGYEVEGEGCSVEVKNELRGVVAAIKRKRFSASDKTPEGSYRFSGRFTSAGTVLGKLAGSVEGECSGMTSTAWQAKKGKRPPVDRSYDGRWEGPVMLPAGLDPAIVALVDLTIEFRIEKGRMIFVSAPWVVRGIGCEAALAGRILWDLDPPIPLADSRLDVAFSSSAAGTKTWSVDGAFTSRMEAAGTLEMSGTSGAFVGACTGELETSWTATRQ